GVGDILAGKEPGTAKIVESFRTIVLLSAQMHVAEVNEGAPHDRTLRCSLDRTNLPTSGIIAHGLVESGGVAYKDVIIGDETGRAGCAFDNQASVWRGRRRR